MLNTNYILTSEGSFLSESELYYLQNTRINIKGETSKWKNRH